MNRACGVLAVSLALVCGVRAENLFPGGTFTETTDLKAVGMTNGGTLALHMEEGSWNRCCKLTISRAYTNEQGFVTFVACGWIGSDGQSAGIPVKGDTVYDFSLELKGGGTVRQATVGFRDWQTGPWAKDARVGKTSLGTVALSDGWTRFRGSFRTRPDMRRAVLEIKLWQSTQYPPVTLRVGDCVFIDNVTVEESPYVLANLKANGLRFVAAPVAVDSDFAVPFLPRELFAAPSNVVLKAAVNEYVDLPVAVANLTEKPADYRVVLETVPTNKFNAFYTGDWGLEGLEPARVIARGAVRMKDTTRPPASVRLDPLPRLNEAQTITVPPGEAGLVWFDINLTDARPGTYRGRVRVIPLGEPGDWVSVVGYGNRRYVGPLQDIAVSLEVRPIVLSKAAAIPSAFFQHPASEREMDIFTQLGVTEYQATPWSVGYAQDADGNLDLDRPTEGLRRAVAQMRRERAWAAARGVKATYFVGFSCFDTMNYVYNAKKVPGAERRLWPQFVRGLKKMMNDAGIADGEYNVETFDEPDPKRFDLLLWAHEAARRVAPDMKLTLTLGAHTLSAEEMRRLDPVTDSWILWSHGYFKRKEHLDYVADALRRGKLVWHYQCDSSPRAPIFECFRRHAWFGEAFGLSGNQFFLLHDAQGGIGERDWKAPTEGGIVYRSFDDFIPSARYMNFRRGVNDVKYLAKLRELAGGDPEVRAFLHAAAQRVVETGRIDRTAADRVREEVAARILRASY